MEKEVTGLMRFSMLSDLVYRVLSCVMVVLSACYVVRDLSMGWIVFVAALAVIPKTLSGLFNYSFFPDFIHYYCDLFSGLIVGWGIGNWYSHYLTGFYEFSLSAYILPTLVVIGLTLIKVFVPMRRSYKCLFK